MQTRPEPFNFILPTKVEFGHGVIELLPAELARNDLQKAVFIMTPGRKRSGMLDGPILTLKRQ